MVTILSCRQEKRHQLFTMAGLLKCPLIGRFDFGVGTRSLATNRTLAGSRIDLDMIASIYPVDLKVRYAYDMTIVGHVFYLHQIEFANSD